MSTAAFGLAAGMVLLILGREYRHWTRSLGRILIQVAARMQLIDSRMRLRDEWLGELDELRRQEPECGGVTFALGVLLAAPRVRLISWSAPELRRQRAQAMRETLAHPLAMAYEVVLLRSEVLHIWHPSQRPAYRRLKRRGDDLLLIGRGGRIVAVVQRYRASIYFKEPCPFEKPSGLARAIDVAPARRFHL